MFFFFLVVKALDYGSTATILECQPTTVLIPFPALNLVAKAHNTLYTSSNQTRSIYTRTWLVLRWWLNPRNCTVKKKSVSPVLQTQKFCNKVIYLTRCIFWVEGERAASNRPVTLLVRSHVNWTALILVVVQINFTGHSTIIEKPPNDVVKRHINDNTPDAWITALLIVCDWSAFFDQSRTVLWFPQILYTCGLLKW